MKYKKLGLYFLITVFCISILFLFKFFENESSKEENFEVFNVVFVSKEGGSVFPRSFEVKKNETLEFPRVYPDVGFKLDSFFVLSGFENGNFDLENGFVENVVGDIEIGVGFLEKDIEVEKEDKKNKNEKEYEDEEYGYVEESEDVNKYLDPGEVLGQSDIVFDRGVDFDDVYEEDIVGEEKDEKAKEEDYGKEKDEEKKKDEDEDEDEEDEEKKEFLVQYFSTQGGEVLDEYVVVEQGGFAKKPEIRQSEGYVFVKFEYIKGYEKSFLDSSTGMVFNVFGDVEILAVFEKEKYVLNYNAHQYGGILGYTMQEIFFDECSSEVSAVAKEGFEFVSWSDGIFENPRVDCNVNESFSVFANFEQKEYEVRYVLGGEGGILEKEIEFVKHGESSLGPEYDVLYGHRFSFFDIVEGWENVDFDYSTGVVNNVFGDVKIMLYFNVKRHSVRWESSHGGRILPNFASIVHGGSSEVPEIEVHSGHYFENFEFVEGSENADMDSETGVVSNVVGPVTLKAHFEIFRYRIDFVAEGNGSISGETTQIVDYGVCTTEVTAVPDEGYSFKKWSDGIHQNPRVLCNATEDTEITAYFE